MTHATKEQIKAINAILARAGQMNNKPDIIHNATGGRTVHSSELSYLEAKNLLIALNSGLKSMPKPTQKMINKLFAMAHQIGWIPTKTVVTPGGQVEEKKDYTALMAWVEKYGYLHKPLISYSYAEMPKLVVQFELGPYQYYLSKI